MADPMFRFLEWLATLAQLEVARFRAHSMPIAFRVLFDTEWDLIQSTVGGDPDYSLDVALMAMLEPQWEELYQ